MTNGGFWPLETAWGQVSEKGLNIVEQHLNLFEPCEENTMMLQRLRVALSDNQRLSGADACFYKHELFEAALMRGGMEYEDAHKSALRLYKVQEYNLYHPSVISALPHKFNSNWRKFWGLA